MSNEACDIATRAIEILETEGWTQGQYYKEGEGYCVLGALYKAAGFDFAVRGEDSKPASFIINKVNDVTSEVDWGRGLWPSWFNDRPQRIKKDVIDKLKEIC